MANDDDQHPKTDEQPGSLDWSSSSELAEGERPADLKPQAEPAQEAGPSTASEPPRPIPSPPQVTQELPVAEPLSPSSLPESPSQPGEDSLEATSTPSAQPFDANEFNSQQASTSSTAPQNPPRDPPRVVDRELLLQQARLFLRSPEIRSQDMARKRSFLEGKGLTAFDIAMLLDESAPPPPPLPPRTYPGAKEPHHLIKRLKPLMKFLLYFAGVSASATLLYSWIILPRFSSVLAARAELQKQRLAQLESLQATMDEINLNAKQEAIDGVQDPSTETENLTEEAIKPLDLSTRIATLQSSLNALKAAQYNASSETLSSVSNLTGFISSKLYSPSQYSSSGGKLVKRAVLGPVEEEVRSEIRALKGLALNRRSFVSATLSIPQTPVNGPSPVA